MTCPLVYHHTTLIDFDEGCKILHQTRELQGWYHHASHHYLTPTTTNSCLTDTHPLPGYIQVSGATRALLGEQRQQLAYTGGIDVKGKGMMDTYLWSPPPPADEPRPAVATTAAGGAELPAHCHLPYVPPASAAATLLLTSHLAASPSSVCSLISSLHNWFQSVQDEDGCVLAGFGPTPQLSFLDTNLTKNEEHLMAATAAAPLNSSSLPGKASEHMLSHCLPGPMSNLEHNRVHKPMQAQKWRPAPQEVLELLQATARVLDAKGARQGQQPGWSRSNRGS